MNKFHHGGHGEIRQCLALSPFLCYIYFMTIEQTVDIPANRRVHLDFQVPVEIPIGRAQISVTPLAETPGTRISLLSLRGSCKGLDTMEAYFERKRADKELENRNGRRETVNA
jgi:hypothetical protein